MSPRRQTSIKSSFLTNRETSQNCAHCKGEHFIYKCDSFLKLEPGGRHAFIKKDNRCFNCLASSHLGKACPSKWSCRLCHKRHHTLLHFPTDSNSPVSGSQSDKESSNKPETNVQENSQVKVMTNIFPFPNTTVLFSTAMVAVTDARGNSQVCRALLDSASQASFVSQRCANRLGLVKSVSSIPIRGVNQMTTHSNLGTITSTIKPCQKTSPQIQVEMIILPSICDTVPSAHVKSKSWKFVRNLGLADPQFNIPGDIDILLGADVYARVLKEGLKRGSKGEPNAINTEFGWVLLGKVEATVDPVVNTFCTSLESLNSNLKRFWELEQVPQVTTQSVDDALCEKIFLDTHSRDHSGKFIVKLPFRENPPELGNSYNTALRRFVSLEKRLVNDPPLYSGYSAFMKDYLAQGHMSLVTPSTSPSINKYYIPHLCVVKPLSTSTRLRVVFDASAKSSSDISLNDMLLVGPKLQNEISVILLSFRTHRVVFTADVRQMYRQIWVNEEHRGYQTILWRFSPSETIQEYRLNTVTFGVSSSPYQALRVLNQLAQSAEQNYPLAARAIRTDTYVDDIVTGANTVEEALELQSQLISILGEGGFELRKWSSNHSDIVNSVPIASQQSYAFDSNDSNSLNVLGLQWCPVTDSFSYKVFPLDKPCTKRNILSELSRIYDPLGFLAPLTLFAKHLMQLLWSLGVQWDDPPPLEVQKRWIDYKNQLSSLSSITIPRQIISPLAIRSELHGFSDASETGYAAVIYLRQEYSDETIGISLMCAKSKVSPLKRVSIPRLELCAAVLLADLVEFVLKTYQDKIRFDKKYAWSDSTVALTWIQSSPHKYKSFVANRVSQIQDKIAPQDWYHISGKDNPADCASRGLPPLQLVSHSLWWAGPSFLYTPHSEWTPSTIAIPPSAEIEEETRTNVFVTQNSLHWVENLLNKFSSLRKIQGIVAYTLRFVKRIKSKTLTCENNALTAAELQQAMLTIVRSVQRITFSKEIAQIESGHLCSKPLRKLAPFISEDGLLRVGGRLRHSQLPYDARHPLLLPRNSRLTELIIEHTHATNLHPGPRTLQYLISQQYWILSVKRAIHQTLSKCNRCFRVQPTSLTPIMGDLPSVRISQVKPFAHTGVDFAGPFSVTMGRRRGTKSSKAYICVFVCMATKALHLEVVSSLSADAFIAALRRFVARRGRCIDMYSDQGTNFIGANNILSSHCKEAAHSVNITWHFNPPASPHFGGLWEAGVKSVKTHLKRVIGNQILTFEELTTVLTQIEALLNSRPLSSMSPDPNDLTVLTPGHFLTLEPLCSPPESDLTSLKINRLSRWQLIQRMQQDFWQRWHREYLHTLQQRHKWTSSANPLKLDALVVIKDKNLPPLQWKMGRVIKLYPSPDNVTRIVQIRTETGTLDRPVVKLCPLPAQ